MLDETVYRQSIGTDQKLPTIEEVLEWLVARIAEFLAVDPGEIDVHCSMETYALDSAETTILSGELEDWLGIATPPTLQWEYPSLKSAAAFLSGYAATVSNVERNTNGSEAEDLFEPD